MFIKQIKEEEKKPELPIKQERTLFGQDRLLNEGIESKEKPKLGKRQQRRAKEKKEKKRKSWQTIGGVAALIIFWYVVVGQAILPSGDMHLLKKETQEVKMIDYEVPCTQAYAAKIIDLTLAKDKLSEGKSALWYEKYYKVLEDDLGVNTLSLENALTPITYGQVEEILKTIFKDQSEVNLGVNSAERGKDISINEFMAVYKKVLESAGKTLEGEERDIVILATPADNVGLSAWQLASAGGIYHFEGLILEPLKGKTVRVLVQGNEILNVEGILSEKSVIKTCTLEVVDDKNITVEVNKIHLTYANKGIKASNLGKSGALTLSGDTAIAFEQRVGEVGNEKVPDSKVASGEKQSVQKEKGNKDKNEPVQLARSNVAVRVLLSDGGEYHQVSVKLKGNGAYKVTYNGETSQLAADTYWKDSEMKWVDGAKTVRFEPVDEKSGLTVYTITKTAGNPTYKGALEVRKEGDHFILINEVNMEDYVAGVIPSEMPTSYDIEALKVQAIAARTYAYAAMQGDKFTDYGAQIDDTTASQVYNNTGLDDRAYKAAALTAGQVLENQEGQPISSKFFSTSCGYTANYGEVWASESFPGYTPEYLVSEKQYEGKDVVKDMQIEENAQKFFKMTAKDLKAYDEDSPWFRWKVTLTPKEITALMKPAIAKISQSSPNLVKVKNKSGEWESRVVENIGTIQKLSVLGRGEGGNILALQVTGENATVKVNTEYLIRSLFASNNNQSLKVIRSDGSSSGSMSLLPSAFFAIDTNKDGSFTLYGGGFGHGVGMSQEGANGMAEMGKDYKEIIEHYYPSLEIASIG
ncbi:SpoIID/LytB domain-containing protein [Cellulosilyticum ruminicola]|uniref:SpoIID/LytB domain-containing protein n=1 Tax=Cellulosilyticum ruminicola TaxID=425254 RepID=UPI0006D1C2E8|nr:SpoIID/LytB domain-containing protein [Cellulosilyticum ruminicola]